ncbi:tetratricopeptide repeat protein [Pseudonocardia kujensis]|uniref:tetratricopeptide repeat protein n=1 Tax=Pseudonocardia kujensis TaxID=1128675 RepID=UPI001E489A31|nr:tetratricopeptide repeat protein [Pseudonocardia kujensis]MCE0763133.1 tetratricopeptide repeat protein [Pseudonocardia kujensis]
MSAFDTPGQEGDDRRSRSRPPDLAWAERPVEELAGAVPAADVADVMRRFRALDALDDLGGSTPGGTARADWRRELGALLTWAGRDEEWLRGELTAGGRVDEPVHRLLNGDVTVRVGLAERVVTLLGGRWDDEGYRALFEAARAEGTGESGQARFRQLSGLTGADPVDVAAEIVPPVGELPVLHGRDAMVADLVARARPLGGPALVLVGEAGLGKTSTARVVAAHLDGAGRAICVTAHDLDDVCDGLRRVARLLGAPTRLLDLALRPDDPAERADALWALLDDADDPWVVLLDDAGPAAVGHPAWARRSPAGTVLVTTRHGDAESWGHDAAVHRVQGLDAESGARIVLDRLPAPARTGWVEPARRLSALLGGLPLALRGAGEAAAAGGTGRLEEMLVGLDPVPLPSAAVAATYAVCLDAVPHDVRDRARELLAVVACLHPDEALPSVALPEDPEALDAIIAVGLLDWRRLGDGTEVVQLHHGFAELARRQASAYAHARAVAVLTAAAEALDPALPGDWPAVRRLHPHAEELLDTLPAEASDAERAAVLVLADRVAGRLVRADGSPLAVALLEQALALTELLGDDHPARLDARQTRAWSVAAVEDDLERAEVLIRRVVADKVRVHGRHHASTLSARDLLGWVLAEQRELDAAARRLLGVLVERTELLGPLHRDTLATRHRLAWVTGMAGNPAEAEEELRAIVRLREELHGTRAHLDVYNSRYRLGCLLAQDAFGREGLEEARAIFGELRRELEDTLDATHSMTLMVRVRQAWVAMRRLRFDDALDAYSDLLADQEKVLGVDHPRTLRTRHTLARLTLQLGGARKAEDDLRAVVRARREVLGPDHHHTMDSRSYRAWALLRCGRVRAAERELQALLADRRRVLGDDHFATLTTRYHLARVVTRRGRLDDARTRFAALAPHAAHVLGGQDRLVLEVRHGAAVVDALRGRLAAAEAELEEIRAVRAQVYGGFDPDTLATREQLTWVAGTSGRMRVALADSRQVLRDTVRTLGERHPHALTALYRRIWLLGLAGRRTEAFALLSRYGSLLEEVGAATDELRCASLTAWLLRLDGRLAEAEQASLAAVELHTEVVGPHEVDTMRSLDALGLVHLAQHRFSAAETIFLDVLDRRVRELGEEHLDTLVARVHLAGVLMRRGSRSEAVHELARVREGLQGVDPEHPLVRRLPEVGWGR